MAQMNESMDNGLSKENIKDLILTFLLVVGLMYCFLVGVKTLETSIKLMGGGFAKGLLTMSASPILGLFAGMLATVLVQSSSATTALIVGLVSSGAVSLHGAIPMIMGANLGTSVTNTLVSLGHIKCKDQFKRAFAAATVHDFFNILTVIVVLPIELATGFLESAAIKLSGVLYGTSAGVSYSSPIKAAIKPAVKGIKGFVLNVIGVESSTGGIILMIMAGAIVLTSLAFIVRTTKHLVENNKGDIIQKILSKNNYATIFFGMLITIAVQSSSITTSLLVPLAGTGILSPNVLFPVTIGANIGTTTTALLAAMAGNVSGLAIALVHFMFNLCGMLVWFVNGRMRRVPIMLAETLAEYTRKNRAYGLAYIALAFFILPFGLTIILK